MFIKPQNNFEIELKVEGKTHKEVLSPNDYYFSDEIQSKIIIKHDTLEDLAEKYGIDVTRVEKEEAVFNDPGNFLIGYRAYGMLNGKEVYEIGEANPYNLPNAVSLSFPLTMADKRAKGRLYLRLLGLKRLAKSDEEFADRTIQEDESSAGNGVENNNTPSAAPTSQTQQTSTEGTTGTKTRTRTKTETTSSSATSSSTKKTETPPVQAPDNSLAKQQAGEAIVDFGTKYKANPTPLKDVDEGTIDWILKGSFTAKKMQDLQKAAQIWTGKTA